MHARPVTKPAKRWRASWPPSAGCRSRPTPRSSEALARGAAAARAGRETTRGSQRRLGRLTTVAIWRGRGEDMAQAAEQRIRHARLSGRLRRDPVGLSLALVTGPRPAREALRTLDAALPENPHPPDRLLRAVLLLAMLGRFDEAWPLARRGKRTAERFQRELRRGLAGGDRACSKATTSQPLHYLRRSFESGAPAACMASSTAHQHSDACCAR